jgi:hypothetical protein
MKEIRTEINIHAPAEKIWNIITDFRNYPTWNPFIKSIEGQAIVGNQLTTNIQAPGMKAMTFKPTILVADANKEFRWLGRTFFGGLFDGEHIFEIKENGNGTSTFIHREKFYGILVPLLKKKLEVNTRKGFELMNEKLKEIAEKK